MALLHMVTLRRSAQFLRLKCKKGEKSTEKCCRSRTEPKDNHLKECSWRVDPLSEAVLCELGYLARLPPHMIMFALSIHSSPLALPRHLRLSIKFVISSRFYNFLIKFVILQGFLIRTILIKSRKSLIRVCMHLNCLYISTYPCV